MAIHHLGGSLQFVPYASKIRGGGSDERLGRGYPYGPWCVRRAMTDAILQPILALLGYPVAANPTQYMMEKAFAHHGLDCRFLTLEVAPEQLVDAVRGMRAMGFAGAACVAPHKQAVIELLDRVTPSAELAGAVNCIFRDEGQLVGDNTEGRGMVQAIARRMELAGKRAVLLGAGQVARAIAAELALAQVCEIVVVNRTVSKAADLATLLAEKVQAHVLAVAWDGDYLVPGEADLLIHATSISTEDADEPLPLNLETLRSDAVVADVTLNPPTTRLLSEAEGRGCQTVNGLEMFIEQAVLDLRQWTGIDAERTVMREAVEEFLLL
jgi:shikimate dehydrogenase